MLKTANLLVIVGMALLAVALTSALLFVTDFLFGGVLLLWLWYAIPLSRFLAERSR